MVPETCGGHYGALWRPGRTITLVGDLGEICGPLASAWLTQEQVAERSGVHAIEVSRIEAGMRDLKISTLRRLAWAVEVPPVQLLD